MQRQLENIQVMEYYLDPELDPTAPHDLHSKENIHDLDLYQRTSQYLCYAWVRQVVILSWTHKSVTG